MKARVLFAAILAVAVIASGRAYAAAFEDVLDTPALKSPLAAKSLLNGLARAGSRIVAVGSRGHIVFSDDQGQTWTQASVPVSSDLVAVHFASPVKGWAVGHSGVVLHSSDGGATWTKQMDGRDAARIMANYYSKSSEPNLVRAAQQFAEEGPDKPFLDVWFDSETNGFVVGTFNLIFRTVDGGRNWEPWFDRSENPGMLHLYAVRRIGGDLFISGEQGLVMKLASSGPEKFRALKTQYKGTFFGITGAPGKVIIFGLRGNAFRSADGGASWKKVNTGVEVGLTGATVTAEGRIMLVSQEGHVLVSGSDGASFRPAKVDRPIPASAAVALDGNTLVLAGIRGVQLQRLQANADSEKQK